MKSCHACTEANPADTENRIILITDAEPNVGDISDQGLGGSIKNISDAGIYTTIIGGPGPGQARPLHRHSAGPPPLLAYLLPPA